MMTECMSFPGLNVTAIKSSFFVWSGWRENLKFIWLCCKKLLLESSLQSYVHVVSPWLCIRIQPKKIMRHEDHEFGGLALCLAVLHLASAEDRFSWGGCCHWGSMRTTRTSITTAGARVRSQELIRRREEEKAEEKDSCEEFSCYQRQPLCKHCQRAGSR